MTAIRLFVIAAHKSYSNRTANTRRQIQINSVEQPCRVLPETSVIQRIKSEISAAPAGFS
jgi:hypothetical protein